MTDPISTIESITGQQIAVYDANYDNSQMDQEDFLEVLLASFRYQDPFEAEDIGQFIDNTVKLRELEVLNDFESSVNTLAGSSKQLLEAANLIDKKIMYEGNSTYFQNGVSQIEYSFDRQVDFATLYIYDQYGQVVYQQNLDNLYGDRLEVEVAGLEDGYYNVAIIGKNGEEDISPTIRSSAVVTGVERDSEGITLITETGAVKLEDVYKIGG